MFHVHGPGASVLTEHSMEPGEGTFKLLAIRTRPRTPGARVDTVLFENPRIDRNGEMDVEDHRMSPGTTEES